MVQEAAGYRGKGWSFWDGCEGSIRQKIEKKYWKSYPSEHRV